MFTLTHSINFAQPYIEYAPLNAGLGGEPATSICSMIRNTFMNAPMTWPWNRNSLTFNTVQGQQDYPIVVADFGFMENFSMTASVGISIPGVTPGKVFQGNDVLNFGSLTASSDSQRSESLAVQSTYTTPALSIIIDDVQVTNNVATISTLLTNGLLVGESVTFSGLSYAGFLNGVTAVVTGVTVNTSFTVAIVNANYGPVVDGGLASVPVTNWVNFRTMGVPNGVWAITVIYQKRAAQFGPYFITSAANHVGANTTYTGSFDPLSFPAGAIATITGFVANTVNNGSFTVVSCSTTSLVLANGAGVAETISAYATNLSWGPIPDQYSDVYNNLFLSEALSSVDEAKSQLYRQRGIAAFLAKASGLSETQKKAFVMQWMARQVEEQSTIFMAQQGNQGRGV